MDASARPDLSDLWDFDDVAASRERFVDAAAAACGAERDVYATQIARAHGLLDEFDAGHAVLDALTGDDPEVRTRVALERGRLHRSAGDDATARPCFQDAVQASAGLDALQVDALHMLALVQHEPEAIATTERALAVAAASADPAAQAWRASLLNNLGMIHADAGRWQQALDLFERAHSERARTGPPARERVARWMVGWALRNLGRRDQALALQRQLHAENLAAGADDPFVQGELALLEEP